MPIVSTKLIGTGKEGDPFRANFPTYSIASYDFDNARILIHVPDDDVPDATHHGAKLHKHLDSRYAERSGEFRPEVYAIGGQAIVPGPAVHG